MSPWKATLSNNNNAQRTCISQTDVRSPLGSLIASEASVGQNLCEFSVPLSFKVWDTRGSYIGNGKRQILQVRDAIGRQRRSDRCIVVVSLEVIILALDFKVTVLEKEESSRSSHAP
jgi:hypothetical protein